MAWDSNPNVVQGPDGVEITAKWFSTPALIAGAIGIYPVFDLLSGFVIQVWPGIGSRSGPWLALLGIFAAGALGYAALACCINRKRVEIRTSKIIISNGPLPVPGKNSFKSMIYAWSITPWHYAISMSDGARTTSPLSSWP